MLRFSDLGPSLCDGDIARLEFRICNSLPCDYRDFLLSTNGCVPTPNKIDVLDFEESPTDIQVFFGINRHIESSCLEWNLNTFSSSIGNARLPIACDSGGNLFCLSLSAEDYGAIVYFYFSVESDNANTSYPYCSVSPDFTSLLSSIHQ